MMMSLNYLEVVEVAALDDRRLSVRFNDGVTKEVDLTFLVETPPPVFVKLKIEDEFEKVGINPVGGISWSCGADLSAEYLRSI